MRQKSFVLMVCLVVFLLLPGLGNAEEGQTNSKKIKFGVKLTGGINYLAGGDPNAYHEGHTDYFSDYAVTLGGTMEGEMKNIHMGMDFEGDVIIYLSPRFGISIGMGYICGKKGEDESKITITSPGFIGTYTHDTQIRAIPIKLGVYYSLPISSKIRVVLNGGAGYYFAKWSDYYRHDANTGFWYTRDQVATGSGFGFQGGAGFEFDVSKSIAFVVEGYGRYAKIGGFEGDWNEGRSDGWSYSTSGTVYYWEWYSSTTLNWYQALAVSDTAPGGPTARNVREGKVDFSGFMLRVGIRIRF